MTAQVGLDLAFQKVERCGERFRWWKSGALSAVKHEALYMGEITFNLASPPNVIRWNADVTRLAFGGARVPTG
jgi:hypothetical protein